MCSRGAVPLSNAFPAIFPRNSALRSADITLPITSANLDNSSNSGATWLRFEQTANCTQSEAT